MVFSCRSIQCVFLRYTNQALITAIVSEWNRSIPSYKYTIFLLVKLAYKVSKSCVIYQCLPYIDCIKTTYIWSSFMDMFVWSNDRSVWLHQLAPCENERKPVLQPCCQTTYSDYSTIFFRAVVKTTPPFLFYTFLS